MATENDGQAALKADLDVRFNRMLNGVLSNTKLLCKNDYQYQEIRKKVLRLVNDTKRDINVDIDTRYEVTKKSPPLDREDYQVN